MSVKLSTRQVGDVTVVDVAGRITLGEGSSALRDCLRDMVGKSQKKILLNLGDVSYIDSSGIGELVSGFTTVTNQGGQLKLLNLTKRVKDLLQITKLYTVFDVHDDEAARRASRKLGPPMHADTCRSRHFCGVIGGSSYGLAGRRFWLCRPPRRWSFSKARCTFPPCAARRRRHFHDFLARKWRDRSGRDPASPRNAVAR